MFLSLVKIKTVVIYYKFTNN